MTQECESLFHVAKKRHQILSTYNVSLGTQVEVVCAAPDFYRLDGNDTLLCTADGWVPSSLPSCKEINHVAETDSLREREIIIIGCAAGVVFLVLLALFALAARVLYQKRRDNLRRSERLAATLEKLSIRDPLDELVRRESKRGYNNPVNVTVEENGIQRVATMRRLYKIWSADRVQKSFAYAESLDELKHKAREKLDLKGELRVVLEEDGTEVDNDVTLSGVSGKPLLFLTPGDVWTDPKPEFTLHRL